MILTLDVCGSTPLYQQLRDQIVTGIARGDLRPGVTPILKVTLEDVTVYANSRDPDQTRQWAALLLAETGVY